MEIPPQRSRSASVEIDRHTLRLARQERGFSQVELARLCQITSAFVSLLESGRRTHVSPHVYVALCKALRIGPTLRLNSADSAPAA